MTPNIQFLIHCCQTNPTTSNIEQVRKHITHLSIQQLSEMTSLAHAHGIFPLVYHAVLSHATNLLSQNTLAELKQQNLTIVMRNMQMTAELIRITKLLEENGVKALAFKGPTLAKLAYGDITLRQYSDLDILIDEKHLYQVAQLIVEENYEPMDSIKFLKNEAKLQVEKNYEFFGKKNGIKLEIHWRLINSSFLKKFKNHNVWKNTQEVTLNKTSIRTLDSSFLLIYLCNHGASHMWERIEWIADIDRLIRSTQNIIDWDKTLSSSIALHSNTTLLLGLGLTNKILDTPLPTEILAVLDHHVTVTELISKTINSLNSDILFHDHTSKKKNLKVFLFHLLIQDTLSTKLRFLLHTIFGYTDRDVMAINLPRFLFFLYYPIHIGRTLKKYTIDPIKSLFIKTS